MFVFRSSLIIDVFVIVFVSFGFSSVLSGYFVLIEFDDVLLLFDIVFVCV